MGQGEGLPPMGKRDLLEDPFTGSPVLDISRAAGPPAPNISGSPRIPPTTCGHTPGLPCKIKCTCSGSCIGALWRTPPLKTLVTAYLLRKGYPLLFTGKGRRGVGKHSDLSLW